MRDLSGLLGLTLSEVGVLEIGGWDVSAVLVATPEVEPVHTNSAVASSTCSTVCQGPRGLIRSVLHRRLTVSARALSFEPHVDSAEPVMPTSAKRSLNRSRPASRGRPVPGSTSGPAAWLRPPLASWRWGGGGRLGCFVAPVRWGSGQNPVALNVTADGWPGGTVSVAVPWPARSGAEQLQAVGQRWPGCPRSPCTSG